MAARIIVALSLCASRSSAAVFRLSGQAAARSTAALDTYTFQQFARGFGRTYEAGSDEYAWRLSLFQAEVKEIRAVNARNAREGRLWKAGIHPFMDWTKGERRKLNGYKPSRAKAVGLLQSGARAFGNRSNVSRGAAASGGLADAATGGLPAEAGPSIRDQGNCGSCWAISAIEAVEAQLQHAGHNVKVSPQALLDCVPNPRHCGGSGGCNGATGELAYAFMRDYGIPLEQDLPYIAINEHCAWDPKSGPYPTPTRVRVAGWNALPSNKAEPLMQALVSQGPAVVAVDGNSWFHYASGIFDSCEKDATIGHAVLAKGFGGEGGHNYWLIQNSWGSEWGERGHIRLLRRADDDGWCGTDRDPKVGLGCDGGPSEVRVCGACGVLYDSLVPEGVRLER